MFIFGISVYLDIEYLTDDDDDDDNVRYCFNLKLFFSGPLSMTKMHLPSGDKKKKKKTRVGRVNMVTYNVHIRRINTSSHGVFECVNKINTR